VDFTEFAGCLGNSDFDFWATADDTNTESKTAVRINDISLLITKTPEIALLGDELLLIPG
jgi:hypothetical protein